MLSSISLQGLLSLLNKGILQEFNTELIGGFSEPFYKAAVGSQPAQIQFSHDYIRSALHELSHWCVAGPRRRLIDDFGYWYAEDGRTQQQQDEFFKVEIRPQAIEWAFSIVCGVKFEPSVDNLNNEVVGQDEFEINLKQQLNSYLKGGFPARTERILSDLANHRNITDFHKLIETSLN